MYAINYAFSVPFNFTLFTQNAAAKIIYPRLFIYKFVDNLLLALFFFLQKRYAHGTFSTGRAVMSTQEKRKKT